MTTLRDHLEAIRWDAGHLSEPHNRLERIHGHAVYALAILDESKKTFGRYEGRIVPDPEEAPHA